MVDVYSYGDKESTTTRQQWFLESNIEKMQRYHWPFDREANMYDYDAPFASKIQTRSSASRHKIATNTTDNMDYGWSLIWHLLQIGNDENNSHTTCYLLHLSRQSFIKETHGHLQKILTYLVQPLAGSYH